MFTLQIHKNERHVTFAFCNSGNIVPEEYRATIFEKYLSPGKHTLYNKGLGLNYSKMMCTMHDGNLSFRVSDRGLNEFTVSLPIEDVLS